jgi:hypothetical protein
VKKGDAGLDLITIFLDDFYALFCLFPGLGGMTEDEKSIGDDAEFMTPSDKTVERADIDRFVDDLVSDSLRACLQAKREMEKPSIFHQLQQGLVHEVAADIAFPEDIEISLDHQAADFFHPPRVGVKSVITEIDNPNGVFLHQIFYLFDDVLWASGANLAAPMGRGDTEIASMRAAAAGDHVGRRKFSPARNFHREIVFLERNQMKSRKGESVQVLDRKGRGRALHFTVLYEGDAFDFMERILTLSLFQRSAYPADSHFPFSPDHHIQLREMREGILCGRRDMRSSQDGERLGADLFDPADQFKALKSVLSVGGGAHDVRIKVLNAVFHLTPAQAQNVGRNNPHLMPLLLQDSSKIEQP